jgi:hypothetical protein
MQYILGVFANRVLRKIFGRNEKRLEKKCTIKNLKICTLQQILLG